MLFRSFGVALLVGLLSFQSMLSGASLACPMSDHQSNGMAPSAAMSAPMDGMNMERVPADHESCDHPMSPQDCQAMASCGIGFVTLASVEYQMVVAARSAGITSIVAAPLSFSSRPQTPPPRA